MMMGLVLLTVGCMWFGQVLFLEKNYADATLASPRVCHFIQYIIIKFFLILQGFPCFFNTHMI